LGSRQAEPSRFYLHVLFGLCEELCGEVNAAGSTDTPSFPREQLWRVMATMSGWLPEEEME
jgi:hypothetical protein